MKKYFNQILLCFSLIAIAGCSKEVADPPSQEEDLWIRAKQQSDLNIFVNLIEKLNMSKELQSESELSVLAPTDDAFNAFLSQKGYSDIDTYLAAEGDKAKQLIYYHIIEGKVKADAFTNAYLDTKAQNAEGDWISIYTEKKSNGVVFINGSSNSIISANNNAGNGYIHKIDGVLEPANIATLLEVNKNFSLYFQAANYANSNFLSLISDPDVTSTFFAPDNDAFDALFLELGGMNNISGFSTVYGQQGVADILLYHTVPIYLKAEEIDSAYYNTRLPSYQIYIHKDTDGNIHLSDPFMREIDLKMANITALNGNIHIISNILLPY